VQVEGRTGKVRQTVTDVLPLCHATVHGWNNSMHHLLPRKCAFSE